MKSLSIIIDILLCIGLFLVFNESETFLPNFIGLACAAGLVYKHRNDPQQA